MSGLGPTDPRQLAGHSRTILRIKLWSQFLQFEANYFAIHLGFLYVQPPTLTTIGIYITGPVGWSGS